MPVDTINGVPIEGMTHEQLLAEYQRLQAAINKPDTRALGYKVGDKGGMVVSGFGRFPVTLYYEQWIKLLDHAAEIRENLEAFQAQGVLAKKSDRFVNSNGTPLAS